MGNASGFSKEQPRLLIKKDPKSLAYLNLPSKLFCRYALKLRSLCGIGNIKNSLTTLIENVLLWMD